MGADIRRDVYRHVLALSPAFFEVTRVGEILSRLTTDTTTLQVVVGSSISIALRNVLLFFGGTAMLVVTSPRLAGMVILIVPVVVIPIIFFGRRVRRLSRTSQDRVAAVSAYGEETLNAIRTVQAFGHEALDRQRFHDRVDAALAAALSRITARGALTTFVILTVFSAIGVILWAGGQDVMAGRSSAGELSAFVFYSVIVASSVGAVSEVFGDIQRAAGATERLLELIRIEPEIAAKPDAVALPEPGLGTIEFHNVRFNYPARPDLPALAEIAFSVAVGERVALVGPSGAGKSTLLQLAGLLEQPDGGEIRIAGESCAAMSDDMPDGFATFLGEKGVRLSGGQRQRIAIARALLRDPSILLLDEATSARDSENERLVQDALCRLMGGRTSLVIAHRLSTVQAADRIVVLDGGRIAATGSHAALVAEGGLYARLARLQFTDGPVAA